MVMDGPTQHHDPKLAGNGTDANPLDRPLQNDPDRTLTLRHGGHRWTFTIESSNPVHLQRTLSRLAADPNAPFDSFDAALIAHRAHSPKARAA